MSSPRYDISGGIPSSGPSPFGSDHHLPHSMLPHVGIAHSDHDLQIMSSGGGLSLQHSASAKSVKRIKKASPEVHSDSEADKDGHGGSDFNKGSCHQCKSRRAIGDLIFCTNVIDKKNKHCRKKYCEGCLKKFYKEDVSDPASRTLWTCPSCRCMCCCAACRRRRDSKGGAPVTPQMSPPQQQHQAIQNIQQQLSPPFAQYDSTGSFAQSSLQDTAQSISTNAHVSYMPANLTGFNAPSLSSMFNQSSAAAGSNDPSPAGTQNSSFAMLYAVAQMPRVRGQIKAILDRKDIGDEEKVESIASLLRLAVVQGDETACDKQDTLKSKPDGSSSPTVEHP